MYRRRRYHRSYRGRSRPHRRRSFRHRFRCWRTGMRRVYRRFRVRRSGRRLFIGGYRY